MSWSDRPDLLLAYDFPPIGGGIARLMAEVARRYPEPGLVVCTGAHPEAAAADRDAGCRVERIAVPARRLRTLSGLLAWRRRALALAAEVGAGFAWCGNVRPAAPVGRAVGRRGAGYGLIVHGGDLLALRRKTADAWVARRRAIADFRDAAWIVANSGRTAALARELLDDLGLPDPGDRLRVVPLGSDPARFRPDLDPEPARRELGLPDGRWLLTVARLVRHKGVDVALEAFARVADRYPDLRYAVAGDGPEVASLRAAAARLGVADRVHLLGQVPDRLLPGLYALATIYVGLSRDEGLDVEGFGIALADAAAAGLPVVAGRSGGTDDAMRDGETGFRVDPAAPEAAAGALARLLDDPAAARAMGRAGRALVERHLNWDRVARDLADLSRRSRASAGRR